MAAYSEVFKRIEKKYKVSPAQRRAVESALTGYLAPDGFGCSVITSVYWDTPELSLIARSLEKPRYKEKLRVRAYGQVAGDALVTACLRGKPAAGDEARLVFFELKKKFKQVVYKRRVGLSLGALFALLDGMPFSDAVRCHPSDSEKANKLAESSLSQQIACELMAAVERHSPLSPSFAIRCERTAWAPRQSASMVADGALCPAAVLAEEAAASYDHLRVTFDDNLCFLNVREGAGCPGEEAVWRPVAGENIAIMELKNTGPLPLSFASLLSKHDIFPTSFSKYGTAYQLTVHEKGLVPGLDCVFGRAARGEGVGLSQCAARTPDAGDVVASMAAKAKSAWPGASARAACPEAAPSHAAAPARRFAFFHFPFKKKGARCA